MKHNKQQSPNWQKYCDSMGFIEQGFPFNEGFPSGGPFGNVKKVYELIVRDGKRVEAKVDYSRQYRAEGIKWKILNGRTLDKHVIVAWREL